VLSGTEGKSKDLGTYRFHEFTTGGTTIREYVKPDGVVFAITWGGSSHPNLAPLLGAYFPEVRDATSQTPARTQGRRGEVRRVQTAHVIVDRWGGKGEWLGRAWVPDLLPAGLDVETLH
jgi:hypothetical protein